MLGSAIVGRSARPCCHSRASSTRYAQAPASTDSNPTTRNSDIARICACADSIDDRTPANDDVMHGGRSSCRRNDAPHECRPHNGHEQQLSPAQIAMNLMAVTNLRPSLQAKQLRHVIAWNGVRTEAQFSEGEVAPLRIKLRTLILLKLRYNNSSGRCRWSLRSHLPHVYLTPSLAAEERKPNDAGRSGTRRCTSGISAAQHAATVREMDGGPLLAADRRRTGRPSKQILVGQPRVVGEHRQWKELFVPALGAGNVRAQTVCEGWPTALGRVAAVAGSRRP